MTSGMRKEPPISTSSPRETITSPPSASEFSASRTAAALLFTTIVETEPEPSAGLRPFGSLRSLRGGPGGGNQGALPNAKQPIDVNVALAAGASLEVELEI